MEAFLNFWVMLLPVGCCGVAFISSLALGYTLRNAGTMTSTSATHVKEERLNKWYTNSLSDEQRNVRSEPSFPSTTRKFTQSIYSGPIPPLFIKQWSYCSSTNIIPFNRLWARSQGVFMKQSSSIIFSVPPFMMKRIITWEKDDVEILNDLPSF